MAVYKRISKAAALARGRKAADTRARNKAARAIAQIPEVQGQVIPNGHSADAVLRVLLAAGWCVDEYEPVPGGMAFVLRKVAVG